MQHDIVSDELTRMENRIYRSLIFEGLDFKAIGEKYSISRATVVTHINAICHKKQVWGVNRLSLLISKFWRDFMEEAKWNCALCEYNKGECININSQFFGEKFKRKNKAENMVCGQFKHGSEEVEPLSLWKGSEQ